MSNNNSNEKIIIYQMLPRLVHKALPTERFDGTLEQNGCGKLAWISTQMLRSISKLGATHVWLTGVIEHATKTDYSAQGIASSNPHVVKGQAGSPYAIRDYYDIDPDLAVDVPNRLAEFKQLVQRIHKCGLKVIIDFVPNHVARQYHSDAAPTGVADLGQDDNKGMFFEPQNNFFYITGQPFCPNGVDLGQGEEKYTEFPAKATGNDCFNASPGVNDWYETVKLNYGVDPWNGSQHFSPLPSTWAKMRDILLYWAGMGIDGFRCDMAHMVPVEFWQWAISEVKAQHPGIIFIAEIYDVNLYADYVHRGGFDYLYDKVTLYDTLCAISKKQAPASQLTRCWQTVEGLQGHMLNFLENHDEQRLASPHHVWHVKRTLPAAVVSATMSGCPFMLYAGQEFGEQALGRQGFSGDDGRTSIFDYCSVPSLDGCLTECKDGLHVSLAHIDPRQKQLHKFYSTLLGACRTEPALGPEGKFFDLMYVNHDTLHTGTQYAYLRALGHEVILVVANFGDQDTTVQVRIPGHAFSFLGLGTGTAEATDLLTGSKLSLNLQPDQCVTVPLQAHGAVLLKAVTR